MDLYYIHEGSTPRLMIDYVSTRGGGSHLGIRQALEAGLASDGGLFIPCEFPLFDMDALSGGIKGVVSLAELAPEVLEPFFLSDPKLASALPEVCARAFNFPTPLTPVPERPGDFFLELYHGPTSAFKDVGARFLAGILEGADTAIDRKTRTVIVATSGDTGGAVAAAFHSKPGFNVVILFPNGMVSPRQEKQLCAWGGNVRAFAVDGTFDDCQRIVKEAFQDPSRTWVSANSINLGRILPQMAYYAWASLMCARANGGKAPGFIIPSGNLGNSLAALWAKKIGFPVGPIVLALNANRGVADFLDSGVFTPARAIATLANAMDVGNPSNLERFRSLYPTVDKLKLDVSAYSFTDREIEAEIGTSEGEWGQPVCPHTATATLARKVIENREPSGVREWIMVSTAHPAKFETIVEPLIGRIVDMPPALKEILRRPAESKTIAPSYHALVHSLFSKT